VLRLNEILTNTLVHLSPKNFFGLQRVPKSFLNAIQQSTEIQEKLFLRQRKRSTNVSGEGFEHPMLTVNPLPLQGNVQSEGFGIDNIFAVKNESS